jgi:hypothetical protein
MRASISTAAVLAAAAALTLAAATAVGAPPPSDKAHGGRQCFFHDNTSGFSAPDDHTVYIRVNIRDVYKLDLYGPCPNVDWTMRIGIQDRGSGGWICTGDLVDILVHDPALGRQRCMGKVVSKLTPEEVKALPKRARP